MNIEELAAKAGLSPDKFRAVMEMYCEACPHYKGGPFQAGYKDSAEFCAATGDDICPMELVTVMWSEDEDSL